MTYVVKHPSIDILAEVTAPDSRHARTTFLDYLSRRGLIGWNQRQAVRSGIMTKRVNPGEVQTNVQLKYRQGNGMPEQNLGVPESDFETEDEYEETGSVPMNMGNKPTGLENSKLAQAAMTPVVGQRRQPIRTVNQAVEESRTNPDLFGSMKIVQTSRALGTRFGKRLRPI